MTLAEQYENDEQYEKAYEEYKKQYENGKENVHILQKLGHLASILNKKDEAEEYYKKVGKKKVKSGIVSLGTCY